jgi:glycopeptide antibiotics resistance protein
VSRLARFALPALVLYSALLAFALLWPTSDRQNHMVVWVGDVLTSLGTPAEVVTFGRLEVLANAVIVVPVSLLGSIAFPRVDWARWTAYGFLGAVAVEVVQGVLLGGRNASFSDVVANTAGILAGAVLVAVVRLMLRNRRVR